MNKDLCFATYVFGNKYHSFIPLYIYSILKAYPNYDIRIYTDGDLSKEIWDNLKKLEHLGNFSIITSTLSFLSLMPKALSFEQISKSIRWLYVDEAFYHYKAIYIGDIDIFILKEAMPIFEQHILHCETMQTCYSNFARNKYLEKNINSFSRSAIKYGVKETMKFFNGVSTVKKLSGLHFFQTTPYLSQIEKLSIDYIQDLNLLAEKKSKKWNLYSFNNECLLYDMVDKAGFALPPIKQIHAADVLSQQNPENIIFRPFHGLHLGLWRKDHNGKINGDSSIMNHVLYQEYIRDFRILMQEDELLRDLLQQKNYANELVQNMLSYYG